VSTKDPKPGGGAGRRGEHQPVERPPATELAPTPEPPAAPAPVGAGAAPAKPRRVLIAGISGGLGILVMRRLLAREGAYDIVGLANSPLEDARRNEVEFHELDISKKKGEDLFRPGDIDAVIHLAFQDDPRVSSSERYRTNVLGTMHLLDWCAKYFVKRVIVVSTASVYGALQDNPTLINEEAPLRGDLSNPGMRDRVEGDRYAQAWMWKYPDIRTVILRPVHVLGRYVQSGFKSYLQLKVVPVMLGFDPMMQVVHEEDVARAIQLALERPVSGPFNIVGQSALPLREILRELGTEVIPVPHIGGLQVMELLWRVGLARFPAAQADFVKFPLVVSGERAKRELRYKPEIPLRETIQSARWRD
jgi:UDP-glucose 4-epimerase